MRKLKHLKVIWLLYYSEVSNRCDIWTWVFLSLQYGLLFIPGELLPLQEVSGTSLGPAPCGSPGDLQSFPWSQGQGAWGPASKEVTGSWRPRSSMASVGPTLSRDISRETLCHVMSLLQIQRVDKLAFIKLMPTKKSSNKKKWYFLHPGKNTTLKFCLLF